MDRKAMNYSVVGAFVAAGFCAFVYIIFTMGGAGGLFRSNHILLGKFKHVKGLHPGSEVSLSGLRVGVIKNIRLANDGSKDLVTEMSISSKNMDKIRIDSIASIKTQGMLGDKYIEISIGSFDLPELKDGDFIASDEAPDILSKSGNLIEGISKRFEAGGDIESLLRNLNVLSNNLANMTSQSKREKNLMNELFYGQSGESLSKSLKHLESILKKIDTGDGTLASVVNDPTVYEDLKAVLGGAKRSSVLRYFMRQFKDTGEKAAEEEKPATPAAAPKK